MEGELIEDGPTEGVIPRGWLKPSLDEIYILLLDKASNPSAYKVTEINEGDNVVIMSNMSKKDDNLLLELDDNTLILNSSKLKYKILDIERVIPFDLDILKKDTQQIDKQLTSDIIKELDISLEEIKEKDIVYTDVELKEQLLSELIYIYDAYDKYRLIKELTLFVDEYLILKKEVREEYMYNINKGESLPKWLIPIVDNPLKLYVSDVLDEGEDKAFNELNEVYSDIIPTSNYYQGIHYLLDSSRPLEPSLSEVGFNTNIHSSNYLRDCIQTETCLGIKGNYKYDRRRNKKSLYMITDGHKKNIHQSDILNIIGLLYIPDNNLVHGLDVTNNELGMKERSIIQIVIGHSIRNNPKLKDLPMMNKTLEYDIELSHLDSLIHYNISERMDTDVFYELIKRLIPTIEQLLSYLGNDIKSKLLNYDDIKVIFLKYNIIPDKLSLEDKKVINNLLSKNINNYLSTITKLSKVIIDIKKVSLSIDRKIELSKGYIMSLYDIPKRNEYLQIFMKNFTRESVSIKEDKLYLYNIYTNEKILCKHYLLSSIYHRDKDAHKSMVSIYGKVPEDGVIYCKNCGEYLCDEGYSSFDGFSNETPIQLREVLRTDTNILEDFEESLLLLVRLIGKNIGVSLENNDIKVILDTYTTFNPDIIANKRYNGMNITDTDEHPRVKAIIKKHAKDKNKNKLIIDDVKDFRTYLKDTNKVLGLLAIMILVVQTSIPKYNLKNNYEFTFIEFESIENPSFNKKVIDYCLRKIHKNIDTYALDTIWSHYKELTNEHKTYELPTIRDQIMNIIHYILSPQYPIIRTRIIDYGEFLKSSSQVFIKSEWPIFKPLRNNKLIKNIDNLLLSKKSENKDYFILNYNNYPVENISLVEPILNDKHIYELLKIPISEIMINKSFLLLFKLTVSNYGKSKNPIHIIDLHIENFLQTISDKDSIEGIFTKHGWKSSRKKGSLSYKELRTKVIPDIISHYQKSKQSIETCYDTPAICNRFIHIHINNYELFLLRSHPKRHYKYILPIIYPSSDFDELSDDFKDKLFKRYCKDPSDNIITRTLTTNYLGKAIINLSGEIDIQISDNIREYEITLDRNITNFKKILKTIQSELLPLGSYIKPKVYDIDDYRIDIHKKYYTVERNILDVLQDNDYYDLKEERVDVEGDHHNSPMREVADRLTRYISYIQEHDNIDKTTISGDIENAFSSLKTDTFLDSISLFISQCDSTPHKKRFEHIFMKRNLKKADIEKRLKSFSEGSKITSDISGSYIYRIKFILSNFKNNFKTSSHISKYWRLSDNNKTNFKNHIKSNLFVLHNDLFRTKLNYRGFYEYKCDYIFDSLLEYISPYVNNLHKLRTNDFSVIKPKTLLILNRYILLFIFNKLVEFNRKLQGEDEEIISLLETNIRKQSDYNELDITESVILTENIIMDLLTDILQMHYDPRWILSNTNQGDLTQRLSKQKEREKQTLIHKLDTMGDDKRASTMELQRMGITNQFKASTEANDEYVQSEEHHADTDAERYNTINANLETSIDTYVINVINGEIDESNDTVPLIPEHEEMGYFNEDDIDEDGQMGDEFHEFHDEDSLDNEFNE